MAHIPYGKLSKKKRREIDSVKRGTWGALSPITRKVPSAKVYDRKKVRRHREDPPTPDASP